MPIRVGNNPMRKRELDCGPANSAVGDSLAITEQWIDGEIQRMSQAATTVEIVGQSC